MLKTFDASLLKAEIQGYWKRFAASATAFARRYNFDPILRTQVNVIGMLVIFAIDLFVVVGVLINFLYEDIAYAILAGVRDSIAASSTQPVTAVTVPTLKEIRADNLAIIAFVTALATAAFGYLVTRVALGPTRSALATQKQFIGNVAHELRTPLAIIKTNTEVALMQPKIDDGVARVMHSTVEELDRVSQILNNLLSLSASFRPERIEFSPVNATAVIHAVIEKLDGLAKTRNLRIEFASSHAPMVWGNPAAVEQIVMNIVKNAITFSLRGGTIAITINQIGTEKIEIGVADSGTGIAQKDLFHIFEPFYRADLSRNRARGGTGLGLAIVSELVKLHRGKISVRSAVGRGTTVTIALPVAPQTMHKSVRNHALDEVAVDFTNRSI